MDAQSVDAMPPLRILVIDDEGAIGEATARMLRPLGHTVLVLGDARVGLEAVLSGAHDLVFCDIMMPGLEGTDLLLQLRTRGCRTPVVLITGDRDPTTMIAGFRAGARDILLKPFGREDVKASIGRAVAPRLMDDSTPGASPAPTATAAGHETQTPIKAGATSARDGDEVRRLVHKVMLRVAATNSIELPVPPRLLSRLTEISEDDDSSEAEIETLVQSCVPVAAAVLRAANMADTGRGQQPVSTLREALIRLGTTRAVRAGLMAAQRASYECSDPVLGSVLNRMWMAHYLTATIGGHLAHLGRVTDGSRAQSLLLFSEVGEMLVLRALADMGVPLYAGNDLNDLTLSVLAATHAQAGERGLLQWKMPAAFAAIALYHGEPSGLAERAPALVALPMIGRVARALANEHFPHQRISIVHALTRGDREWLAQLDKVHVEKIIRTSIGQLQQLLGRQRV